MIKKRFRNAIEVVQTYPSADINLDHNLLAVKIKIRLKKVKKSTRKFINILNNRNWLENKRNDQPHTTRTLRNRGNAAEEVLGKGSGNRKMCGQQKKF